MVDKGINHLMNAAAGSVVVLLGAEGLGMPDTIG
jgi:hypothetical protein